MSNKENEHYVEDEDYVKDFVPKTTSSSDSGNTIWIIIVVAVTIILFFLSQ
jgi:hypothetical protein